MASLVRVVAGVLKAELPAATAVKIGGKVRVRARVAQNAQARYIAYRCRGYVRDELGRSDSNTLEITKEEKEEISSAVGLDVATNFPRIQSAYEQVVDGGSNRIDLSVVVDALENAPARAVYRRPAMRMLRPYRNRSEFIWDILWSLVRNDVEWLDHETELFQHVERRLRKVERMRYFVSSAPHRPRDSEGRDGHWLRRFEYPSGRDPKTLGGKAPNYWTNAFSGILKDPEGVSAPVEALDSLFATPDLPHGWRNVQGRHHTYCDYALHILHLDEVAAYLHATETDPKERAQELIDEAAFPGADDETRELQRRRRFAIRPSWQLNTETSESPIGTGLGPDPTVERTGDPLFEYSDQVRIDELVPGDQLLMRSHPAFYGVNSPKYSAWRLENFLVTRYSPRRVGRKVPDGIELQGHGAGPILFNGAQKLMLNHGSGLAAGLRKARRLSKRHLEDAVTAHENPPHAPYVIGAEGKFRGVVEYRNEFHGRGLAAFWARWVIPHEGTSELGTWRRSLTVQDRKAQWEEYASDNAVQYARVLWKLPFIHSISLDSATRTLTLIGHNLDDDITAIYFATDTQRSYDWEERNEDSRGFVPIAPSATMLSSLAEWTVDGDSTHAIPTSEMTFTGDRFLSVTLPPSLQGRSEFWRPILMTNVRMHVRAQTAFRWNSTGEPDIIGHGEFNIGYFPLWQKPSSAGGPRPTRVKLTTALANNLLDYFERETPEDTIRVIRPRKPIW